MIKITSDSTCDLPSFLLERYHITTIPLGIVKEDILYHDGVDITTADIAAHVDGGGDITTTNAVNISSYEDLFTALRREYDAVIHINIGSGFSSCHQNASIAAQELTNVYPVDSANLSIGQGLMVLAAARAAEEGKSAAEILALLEQMRPRVDMSFVLDRLDYMKKGGRCSSVAALGANLLKLHPCIAVQDGQMKVVKKYRGSLEKSVSDYLEDRLSGTEADRSTVGLIIDTCEGDRLAAFGREQLAKYPPFAQCYEAKAGCTIFSHCGSGTLGIAYLKKE